MLIRKAKIEDVEDVMRVYANARAYMAKEGNASQWADGYPKEEIIREDIAQGKLYICEAGPGLFAWSGLFEPVEDDHGGDKNDAESMGEILADFERQTISRSGVFGVFYFAIEDDPTYANIDGAWKVDGPYGVVHRIAVAHRRNGVGSYCLEYAQSKVKGAKAAGGVRIDTHEDNVPMRTLLEKLGYEECGTIICEDGTPRIAYQLA